jgi:two-component system, chemotaxis family, chemotaxis protein CheY
MAAQTEGSGKCNQMARTVLIVEDSDTTADTLEIALLSLPGVAIAHAPTGRKAWQLIQQERVAAIITDLHMPHMDGYELIERVRAADGAMHVPIIVVSGDSDPATPDKVRRLGADAYFAKPYSPAAVREMLERLLHENSSPSP